MRRVVAVTAGLSQPSTTRLLTDRLVGAVERQVTRRGEGVEVEVIELRELAVDLAHHMLTRVPSARLAAALESVITCDALVAVTPVFTASYSGLFKSFVDVLDTDALRGRPVLLAATAGSARHALVVDQMMRPLFAYLRALTVPTAVVAAAEDLGSTGLDTRIDAAAQELVVAMLGAGAGVRGFGPTGDEEFATPAGTRAPGTTDRFDEVPDFLGLLGEQARS